MFRSGAAVRSVVLDRFARQALEHDGAAIGIDPGVADSSGTPSQVHGRGLFGQVAGGALLVDGDAEPEAGHLLDRLAVLPDAVFLAGRDQCDVHLRVAPVDAAGADLGRALLRGEVHLLREVRGAAAHSHRDLAGEFVRLEACSHVLRCGEHLPAFGGVVEHGKFRFQSKGDERGLAVGGAEACGWSVPDHAQAAGLACEGQVA
ncbi:hypothetical protein [Actinoplanes sp. NPDC051859]|uniref:hypothetical protein n=1 Tax=Actinoplanes sp. NPDC051859 TaxID=3363909 RepID=UPI00378C014E